MQWKLASWSESLKRLKSVFEKIQSDKLVSAKGGKRTIRRNHKKLKNTRRKSSKRRKRKTLKKKKQNRRTINKTHK